MAEVQVKDTGSKGGKVRSKKLNPSVDLTPMVDLAFLLITFFMLVTTFSKPNVMDLGLPAKPDINDPIPEPTEIDLKNSITLIIGKDNRIFYHQQDKAGLNEQTLMETTFDREGITKVIEKAKANATKPDLFTVIIKPTDDAVYKNFVDIMDEMAITNNERYGITDLKPYELDLYKSKTAAPAAAQSPAN